MEKSGAVDRVLKLYSKGIRFGTETTRALLKNLDSPQKNLKIVHVAGTNGKGSVCEYISRILVAAGKKTGTFSSPAVYDYCEQFKINCAPMQREKVEGYLSCALNAAKELDVTGFEVETAAALYAFYKEGCEYAVVECGMGGRDDATNALDEKQVAVLTSVGLEHTAFLGKTLKEICLNKAAIIKNCPATVCAYQPEEVKKALCGIPVKFTDIPKDIVTCGLEGQTFEYGGKSYKTKMPGFLQPYNAACAIEAARVLQISETAIYNGIKCAYLGGRVEVLRAYGKTYILDGAHNPAGFAPLSGLLKEGVLKGGVAVVFGCLSDKDVEGNVKALSQLAQKIIAVRPDNPRGMDITKIFAACRKYFEDAEEAESVSLAVERATECAENVVVCGSFTILSEAKKWIEKR